MADTRAESDTTVLMLAPWPESLWAFRRIWSRVTTLGRVVAIDMPGFGHSDQTRPELIAPEGSGQFLARLIDEWGLGALHVVGPDVGTAAALFLAARWPDRVTSLTVGGGAVKFPIDSGGALENIIEAPSLDEIRKLDSRTNIGDAVQVGASDEDEPEVHEDYVSSMTSVGSRSRLASSATTPSRTRSCATCCRRSRLQPRSSPVTTMTSCRCRTPSTSTSFSRTARCTRSTPALRLGGKGGGVRPPHRRLGQRRVQACRGERAEENFRLIDKDANAGEARIASAKTRTRTLRPGPARVGAYAKLSSIVPALGPSDEVGLTPMTTVPSKPDYYAPERARVFHEETVARHYHLRPPYPTGLFTALAALVVDEPRTILDLGTGTGDLARGLLHVCDRVDAVDVSLVMIEHGRSLAYGDDPRLHWIHGRAEEAPLDPPYVLITAGDSLHWMDWHVVLPRIADMLSPNGSLAIASRNWGTGQPEEREILSRCGVRTSFFRPLLNAVRELVSRGLFEVRGRQSFTGVWRPTIEEYIGCRSSQAAIPADPEQAQAFRDETRALLERLVQEGRLQADGERLLLTVESGIAWGIPQTDARPEAE
jgi:SAM-dependent methyltransferase